MDYSSLCVGRFAFKGSVIGREVDLWSHSSAPEPCRVVYGTKQHPTIWAYHLVAKQGWTDLFELTQHEVPARILLHAFGLTGHVPLDNIARIASMSPRELMVLARRYTPGMEEVTCMITGKFASMVGTMDLASGSRESVVVAVNFACKKKCSVPPSHETTLS